MFSTSMRPTMSPRMRSLCTVPTSTSASIASSTRLGRGGRHSRAGQTVAIFGATGFLGQYVVNELGKSGTNMVIATRGDDVSWRHLKPCSDYGKLVPSYISMKDEASVRDTIKGCDVVINMMGKHYETKHYFPTLTNCSFEQVNVQAAETVARIAREMDVKHLVHVSCSYANKDSSSRFARTKAEGEARVLEQFPGAVVVKPNVLYGEEDRFLNAMANMAVFMPYIPLIEGGQAKVWPAYVGDVGRAVATIAKNYSTAGQTFNLSGTHEYSIKQVFEYVLQQIGRERQFVDVPQNAAESVGKLINLLPNPYLNDDQVKLLTQDCPNAAQGEKSFADLGMNSTAQFETKAFNFVFRFRKGGHFVNPAAERVHHS